MKVHFTDDGWNDYQHWIRNDHAMLGRVNAIIEDARRRPFQGLGKPEALRGDLSGWWSRRISGEHRLVYRVAGKRGIDQRIEIAACRYHYGD
jgi:toxin YoeB